VDNADVCLNRFSGHRNDSFSVKPIPSIPLPINFSQIPKYLF
jgi:hypothetical protein